MKIHSIQLRNFFSFSNSTVNFEELNNLTLVKGETENSDSSNGAGKSSLFEAFFWCLTGKTVRGVVARDVVKFGKKDVKVCVELSHQENNICISRYWSQDKKEVQLSVNGATESFHDSKQGTERIFEVLNVDPNVLSLIGFYGKNFNKFSSLTAKGRAEIIDLISDGEKWEKGRTNAYKRSKELKIEYEKKKYKAEDTASTIRQLKREKSEISEKLKEVEEISAKKIQEIERSIERIKENRDKLFEKEKIRDWKGDLEKEKCKKKELERKKKEQVNKILVEFGEEEKKQKEKIAKINKSIREKEKEAAELRVENRQLKIKSQNTRKQKEETHCLTCGQELKDRINPSVLEEQAKGFDGEIENNAERLEILEEEIAKLEKTTDTQKELLPSIKIIEQEFDKEIEKHSVEIRTIEHFLEDFSWRYSSYTDQIRAAKEEQTAEKNSVEIIKWKTKKEENEKRIKSEEIILENVEEEVQKISKQIDIAVYWVQGFKDLRYSEFNNSIKVFEAAMNSFCSQQGLEFDKVEVSSWKNNSNGEQVPEINIYIYRGDKKFGLCSLSEGEMQRVDIACFFTLALLIEKACGFSAKFCVLDEPLTGLDVIGKQSVFDIVSRLSEHRQMFVIDHDENFKSMFDTVISVRKENGNSEIAIL